MLSVKIGLCLMCENVRDEQRGKISILGFLGVAGSSSVPVPEIQLLKPDLPLGELTFIFVGTASGTAALTDLAYEIFDWTDKLIFKHSQNQEVVPSERSSFVFSIRLLKFPHLGRYKVRMRVDGQPVFTGEFLISEVPPTVS